jgi:hypothetical protein
MVAVSGLISVSAGVVGLDPAFVLCGLVLTSTALLMRRLSWDLALPAAVIALLAVSTIVAVAAAVFDINLLVAPWILASLYILYAVAGAYWASRPAGDLVTSSAPAGRYGWAAYSPAGIAASIGLAQAVFERMPASWAFSRNDLAQHMIGLQQVQRSGSLDYSANAYPRGFHMLAALAAVPNAPFDHPVVLLSYDMRLMAAATWLSLALVLWTGSTLALRFGDARGVPRSVAVAAATLFGVGLLLTNSFIVTFVYNGAASSLLAAMVMFALPLAVLGLETRRRRLIGLPALAAASVMLLAHLWQPLVAVPLLAIAAYAAPSLRTSWSTLTRNRPPGFGRRVGLVAAGSMVMLAVASVPLLSIQAAGGVALAVTGGEIPQVPLLVLLLGMLAAAWLIRDLLRGSTRVYLGSVGGLVLALAVLVRGANRGLALGQYYPTKMLWFLTILLSSILALAIVDLGRRALGPVWRSLDRLGRHTRIGRAAFVALLSIVAVVASLPLHVGNASATLASLARYSQRAGRADLSTVGGASSARFAIATRYATRYGPAVTVPVALGLSSAHDRNGPYIVSKLISFQTGQLQTGGHPAAVCSDVALVTGGSERAVVITQMDALVLRKIMAKQGCGGVPVVRVPGGS